MSGVHGQRFYRPYDSENESGADSDTETTDSWYSSSTFDQSQAPSINSSGIPNFRAFASQMQLRDAAGPQFSTLRDQLTYENTGAGNHVPYSEVTVEQAQPDAEGLAFYGKTEFQTADVQEASIVMIDSRFRDRQAYPQPTFCTLRLPRTYKGITSISMAEMKLLTSFYFFRETKGNTEITIYEKNRFSYDSNNQLIGSTIVTTKIAEGSYNINQLQTELQTKLNYTPLFYDFVNGFNDFYAAFRSSGDLGLNFNEPGDYFFNNTTNTYVSNPTKDTIILHFWRTRNFGFESYSITQVEIAYYYPVLHETLQDENYPPNTIDLSYGLGIDPTITTLGDVRERILYTFQGLDDPVVLAVIQGNLSTLNEYRLKHTFRFYLINKYIVSREQQSQRVYITSPSLNTSLLNLLNIQRTIYLNRALQSYNLTAKQYSLLQANNDRTRAVLLGMYAFLQQNFLTYFAVPWNQYTASYYANSNNTLYIQNGIGVSGLPSNDLQSIQVNIKPISTNIFTLQAVNPTYYWPNLTNIPTSSNYFLLNLSNTTSSFQQVYNMTRTTFDPTNTIISPPNDYIYSDYLIESANAVCPVESGKYTVFKFHSPVRQTLQVETLQRPLKYRVPKYNQSNFNSNINYYYNMPYKFSFTSNTPYPPNPLKTGFTMAYDNLPASNLRQIYGWNSSNAIETNPLYSWNRSVSTSLGLVSTVELNVTSPYRSLFFEFKTPNVQGASPNSNYTYSINVSAFSFQTITADTPHPPDKQLRMFLYHDRGAFQADVLCNRSENPIFYKYSTVMTTSQTSATLSFTAYPSQSYYISLRPDDTNYGNIFIKTVPWFSSNFTVTPQSLSVTGLNPETDPFTSNFTSTVETNFNYAQVYDSNWIQLPFLSSVWLPDPSSAASTLGLFVNPIGYDINGVSTDFTDYIPYNSNSVGFSFNPTQSLAIDPINQYIFQSNSPYDSTIQTYFYSTSLNSLFYPAITSVYPPATVPVRELKIAHYYSLNYIPEPDINGLDLSNSVASNSEAQRPYSVQTTLGVPIPGYTYSSTASSTLQLGSGVLGWNFIPDEGIWSMKKLMFRTAIQNPLNDPNSNIKYIGVYNMGDILFQNTNTLSLSTAIVALSSISRVTYSNLADSNASGFDTKGGTYYEFGLDTNFQSLSQSTTLLGYTQIPESMSRQPESMYCTIAFSEFGFPTTIHALSGSAIPYPLYNNVYVSTTYIDGTRAFVSSYGVVIPSTTTQTSWTFASGPQYGPRNGNSYSQSQYALSMPIGTSVLNYKQPYELSNDPNYLQRWSTPITPGKTIATISNYVLFQDNDFTLYPYTPVQLDRSFTTALSTFTVESIFSSNENTALVGSTGNSFKYYFLGLSNTGGPNNSLRIKTYSPFTGLLQESTLDSSYILPQNTVVNTFTVNDFEQFVYTAKTNTTSTTRVYYSMSISTLVSSFVVASNASTAIHAMDCTTSTLYWLPQSVSNVATRLHRTYLRPQLPASEVWTLSNPNGLSNWSQFAVNAARSVPSSNDRLFTATSTIPYQSNIFYSANWNTTTSTITLQRVSSPLTLQTGQGVQVSSISAGNNGSLWASGLGSSFVWVNRNSEPDKNSVLSAAWQIFYPFQKIVFEKVANRYDPITDLTNVNYPEYPHTMMFYYRNGTAFSNDTFKKWGLESKSNFTVADVKFAGYYFNSYIFNVPLVPSSNGNYQYLTVRGFSPTEAFETLIRFSLTNQYNFGYVSSEELINEIELYKIKPVLFNPTYGEVLSNFNVAFNQSNSYFGQGLLPDFDGSNYNTSNYAGFLSNFTQIYTNLSTGSAILTDINTTVNSNTNYYISTNLPYIFPTNILSRQNYSDPLPFSILWLSSLLPQYVPLLEDWGLGYNLGFAKVDTPYSTYHRADSFYKILEDYIYLRLNPEYPMNRLDSTAKEDFTITRDSTGQVNTYFGKLLLNDFNSFSRSFIANTLQFNPPIPRLEQMYFEWTNAAGIQIDNVDCEWSCSLTITESKTRATAASTLPKLPPKK